MRASLLLALLAGCGSDGKPSSDPADTADEDRDTAPPPGDGGDDTAPPQDTGETGDPEPTDTEDPPGDTAPQETCEGPDLSPAAVAVDATCDGVAGELLLQVEWSDLELGGSLGTPVVGHLTDDNGDGAFGEGDTPDIVLYTMYNEVYLLSGDGSGVHWAQTGLGGYTYNPSPALGDIDLDGEPEIVTLSYYNGDYGVVALDGQTGAVEWEIELNANNFNPVHASFSVADLEGDGDVEVVLGNVILAGADGAVLFRGASGTGNLVCESGATSDRRVHSVLADSDDDGVAEVVTGNTTYSPTGTLLYSGAPTDGAPAVVDVDGDGSAEVLVSYTLGLCATEGAFIRMQDPDNTVRWKYSVGDWLSSVGPPTVADLDGDGVSEIAVMATTYYPAYEYEAFLIALEADGSELWREEIPLYHTLAGSAALAAADIDGDGAYELIHQGYAAVRIYDGATGEVLAEVEDIETNGGITPPALADVDGDGELEIVVSGHTPEMTYTEGGIYVLGGESWPSARPTWSQQAFRASDISDALEVRRPAPPDGLFRAIQTPLNGSVDAALLVDDVCEVECYGGVVELVARVGSAGTEPLPSGAVVSVEVEAEGGWLALAEQTLGASVAPGETSEGLHLEVALGEHAGLPVRVRVYGIDGECLANNNTVELGALCVNPG
jgi:hypothetical protein